MTLTPGAYLKCRRTACGKAHEDVVGALDTDPSMSAAERVEWLKMIEADVVAVRWSTIIALRQLFDFDLTVLERLSLIHEGADLPAPRLCPVCAASEAEPARSVPRERATANASFRFGATTAGFARAGFCISCGCSS